jgi:hypothetical protein
MHALDAPDNQRLAAPAVTSSEDTLNVGAIFLHERVNREKTS